MDKLRTPFYIAAVYTILNGLVALSPSLVRSVFGYEVKDAGALLAVSVFALGLGVVTWAIAANTGKYGGLAQAIVVALAIGIVILLYGWVRGTFTARNVLVPLIINVILGAWIWTGRPKS